MADNTMNQGGKSADRSRETNQDQTRRGKEDTQRSNMGNQREQGQGRQGEDTQRSNMGNQREQGQGRQEEDTQRSNMGNRGQEGQQQSGRINEDMQRTDMANPANVPPQPHKSSVPDDDEESMEQRVSGSRGREAGDTDVDTNEGRATEEDVSGRGL